MPPLPPSEATTGRPPTAGSGAKKGGKGKRALPAVAAVVEAAPHWLSEPASLVSGPLGFPTLPALTTVAHTQRAIAQARASHVLLTGQLSICLAGLGLEAVPPPLALTPWVVDLDLSNNSLSLGADTPLFSHLAHLSALRRLDVSYATLGPTAAEGVELLSPTLVELNLEGNMLRSFPAGSIALASLQWLSLRRNMLTTLPPTPFAVWRQLEVLDLRENRLAALPALAACAPSLKQLLLSDNALTALPADIGDCIGLEVLACGRNHLITLPEELGRCRSLEQLDLGHNFITSVPPTLLVALGAGAPRLHTLILSGNALGVTGLPDELGACGSLEVLLLAGCGLAALPSTMGQLVRLRELCCDGNADLHALPVSLVACPLHQASFRGTKVKGLADEEAAVRGWRPTLRLLDFRPVAPIVSSAPGVKAKPAKAGKVTCKVTPEFMAAMAGEGGGGAAAGSSNASGGTAGSGLNFSAATAGSLRGGGGCRVLGTAPARSKKKGKAGRGSK